MAQTDFYNLNRSRRYPFVLPPAGEYRLSAPGAPLFSDAWVLDFGAFYGASANYHAGSATKLDAVVKSGSVVHFHFSGDSAVLQFTRRITDPEGATDFTEAVVEGAARAHGFLVTGDLSSMGNLPDGTWTPDQLMTVEPTLVVSEYGAEVTTFMVANTPRVVAGAPGTPVVVPDQGSATLNGPPVSGDVTFRAGHNMELSVIRRANTVVFSPRVGGGDGPPCDPVPRYPGDPSVITGDMQQCQHLAYKVGGANGPSVTLTGDGGVSVTPDGDEPHTLVITTDSRPPTDCDEDEEEEE